MFRQNGGLFLKDERSEKPQTFACPGSKKMENYKGDDVHLSSFSLVLIIVFRFERIFSMFFRHDHNFFPSVAGIVRGLTGQIYPYGVGNARHVESAAIAIMEATYAGNVTIIVFWGLSKRFL